MNQKQEREKIFPAISDITSRLKQTWTKQKKWLFIAILFSWLALLCLPPTFKSQISLHYTPIQKLDSSSTLSEEILSPEDLYALVIHNKLQWQTQAPTLLKRTKTHIKDNLFSLYSLLPLVKKTQNYETEIKVQEIHYFGSKDLKGTLIPKKQGFILRMGKTQIEGKWDELITNSQEDQDKRWTLCLKKPSSNFPKTALQFKILSLNNAIAKLASSLKAKEDKEHGKILLIHTQAGKTQDQAFILSLKEIANSKLFLQNLKANKIAKKHRELIAALNTPTHSPSYENSAKNAGELADDYFDTKVLEGVDEPQAALWSWLLIPIFLLVGFLLVLFAENIWSFYWYGLPINAHSLQNHGFLSIHNDDGEFTKQTTREICYWLLDEKNLRYQFRERAIFVLIQTEHIHDAKKVFETLSQSGSRTKFISVRTANASTPQLQQVNLEEFTLLLDFNCGPEQLLAKKLSHILKTQLALPHDNTDFFIIHCPKALIHPLTTILKKQCDYAVVSDISSSIQWLKAQGWRQDRTIFIEYPKRPKNSN